jgi:hypothetical protein
MTMIGTGSERQGRRLQRVAAATLATVMLAIASPAVADDYDPEYSGHPLRIAAYVLHPFGVLVDYLVLRPAHWVGSKEPFATIFGHKDY